MVQKKSLNSLNPTKRSKLSKSNALKQKENKSVDKLTLDNISQLMSLANSNVNFESRYNLLYESPHDAYLLYDIRNFKKKNGVNKFYQEISKTFKFNVNFKTSDFIDNFNADGDFY